MIIQHPGREAAVRETQSNTAHGVEPGLSLRGRREVKQGGELHGSDVRVAAVCIQYVCVRVYSLGNNMAVNLPSTTH